MREIKFRAWDKVNGEMTLHDSFYEVQSWNRQGPELYNYELMQYTGLKDKNGVEIYEGDIISHHGTRDKVYWGGIGWEPFEGRMEDPHDSEKYKIIGNLYENPELMDIGGGD